MNVGAIMNIRNFEITVKTKKKNLFYVKEICDAAAVLIMMKMMATITMMPMTTIIKDC